MPSSLTYNVCWGLSLLEWVSIRRFSEPPIEPLPLPSKRWFKYSDTLFPVFAFLTGFRPLSPVQSVFAIGLGLARNFFVGKPLNALGGLQTIGLAALLLHAVRASAPAPLLSAGSSYLVFRYMAAARDAIAPPDQADREKTHDVHKSMGIATTAATMWIGHCVASGYFSSNDLFVTAVSMLSFGHLTSYAFPKLFAASSSQWSPSSAFISNGISLLNYTITTLISRLLLHYEIGVPALNVLGAVGAHSMELYFLSSALEHCRVPRMVQARIPGTKGKVASAALMNALLVGAAILLEHFRIIDRVRMPFV